MRDRPMTQTRIPVTSYYVVSRGCPNATLGGPSRSRRSPAIRYPCTAGRSIAPAACPHTRSRTHSTSAEGSVKGKKLGRSRISRCRGPKNRCTNTMRVALRSSKLTLRVHVQPLALREHGRGVWRSSSSRRNTLPGPRMIFNRCGGPAEHGANLHRRGVASAG